MADSGQVRAVRLWCRRRADQQLQRCREIQPFRWRGKPHEETRYQLGLTVSEYRCARRWLDEAARRCAADDDHLGLDETLRQIADQHIENVMRYGNLRALGASFEQIREQLELTERELDIVSHWWQDAITATGLGRTQPVPECPSLSG